MRPNATTAQPLPVADLPNIRYEDQLIDRPTAARWLGVHRDTLTSWAREKRGPTVTYVGRGRVRYFVGTILAWLRDEADSTSEVRYQQSRRASLRAKNSQRNRKSA